MAFSCLIVSSSRSSVSADQAFWKKCARSVALARGGSWPVIHLVPPDFDTNERVHLAIQARRDEPILTPSRSAQFEWPSLALHLRAAPIDYVQLAGVFAPDDLLTILVQCGGQRLPVRALPDGIRTDSQGEMDNSVLAFISAATDFSFVDPPISIASGA